MPPILYKRQKQILDFVYQYIKKNDFAPTLSEIAEALGISSLSTVHEHLNVLEAKKKIRRYKGAVRGIEVLDESFLNPIEIELPIIGYIVAGMPIQPYDEEDATIKVPSSMVVPKKHSFVLKVKGESMIEEGILSDDYVVIEEAGGDDIKNGDVIVAILENGFATLKKFFKEKNRIRLEPANSKMKPIFVINITVRGKVIGIIRKYQ